MPSVIDNLTTTIAGYATALAADSVNPQASYTLDGKSVDRNAWRDGLQKLIDALQKTINGMQPYRVVTRKVL